MSKIPFRKLEHQMIS